MSNRVGLVVPFDRSSFPVLVSLEDYSSERVAYALEDLIEAYRAAHSQLFD